MKRRERKAKCTWRRGKRRGSNGGSGDGGRQRLEKIVLFFTMLLTYTSVTIKCLTISLNGGHEPPVAVEFKVAEVRVGTSVHHQLIHHLTEMEKEGGREDSQCTHALYLRQSYKEYK